MGLDPIHFAQGFSILRPLGNACEDIWFQYDWQDGDKVSRDQIARHIADAERDIADACSYWPAPTWVEDERHPYIAPADVAKVGKGYGTRGLFKTIQLDRGYLISGGVRATDLLGTESYTTEDADGDGYDEWAIFTVTVTDDQAAALDTCEVHAFFKVYDAADADNTRTDPSSTGADETWRIRPIRTTLSGTTLTIRIYRWDLFRPNLQDTLSAEQIDADDVDNYVDEVTFYRVYNDPSDQVLFGWANEVSGCDSPACAWATQTGCLKVSNTRNAQATVQPSTWDADDEEFDRACWSESTEPQLVWINYYAGYRPEGTLPCDLLDNWWARTIAWLATARMDIKLCTCSNVSETVDWLRMDARVTVPGRAITVTPDDISNPFGSRRGEIWAWRRVAGHGKGGGRKRGRTVRL